MLLLISVVILSINYLSSGYSSTWIEKRIERDFNDYSPKKLTSNDLLSAYNEISHPYKAIITIQDRRVDYKSAGNTNLMDRLNSIVSALRVILKNKAPLKTSFILDYSDEVVDFDSKVNVPVLGFCKKSSTKGILIPDSPNKSSQIPCEFQIPWESKISKAYFLGATTGGSFNRDNYMSFPRSKLVRLGQLYPDLVYSGFSSFAQVPPSFISEFEKQFPLKPFESDKTILRYKYPVDADGNSNGWFRLPVIFHSNSLCIKHKSPFIQWYYSELKPNYHYLEVERDFSDLIEKIDWAERHPKDCKEMVLNANKLAEKVFDLSAQNEYLYKVIQTYSHFFGSIDE